MNDKPKTYIGGPFDGQPIKPSEEPDSQAHGLPVGGDEIAWYQLEQVDGDDQFVFKGIESTNLLRPPDVWQAATLQGGPADGQPVSKGDYDCPTHGFPVEPGVTALYTVNNERTAIEFQRLMTDEDFEKYAEDVDPWAEDC